MKTEYKKQYRLTDYKTFTSNVDEYINDWEPIGTKVAKILGVTLSGFDPGYKFYSKTTGSFDLPVEIAIRISKLVDD